MGRVSGIIGKLLSFTRVVRNDAKLSDVKVDVGGGDILTAEYTHPSGDDSFPLPGDYPSAIRIPRSGRILVVGFVETDAQQKALAGDKRLYARNSDREEVVELWLKSDGTALLDNENGSSELRPDGSFRIQNGNGYIELLANGTVNINGTTINPAGDVESLTTIISPSMVVNSKELAEHDHPITGGSSAPGPTGPNN